MLWHRQAIFESKGDKLSSSAEGRIRTQGLRYLFTSRLNACWQTDWAIEDQAKTWTRQPVPMISKHSAHSTLQPIGFRTWLWRYTCLLLLISMFFATISPFHSKLSNINMIQMGQNESWNSTANTLEIHIFNSDPVIYWKIKNSQSSPALILGLRPANERRRYKVTPSLIGWAQT